MATAADRGGVLSFHLRIAAQCCLCRTAQGLYLVADKHAEGTLADRTVIIHNVILRVSADDDAAHSGLCASANGNGELFILVKNPRVFTDGDGTVLRQRVLAYGDAAAVVHILMFSLSHCVLSDGNAAKVFGAVVVPVGVGGSGAVVVAIVLDGNVMSLCGFELRHVHRVGVFRTGGYVSDLAGTPL